MKIRYIFLFTGFLYIHAENPFVRLSVVNRSILRAPNQENSSYEYYLLPEVASQLSMAQQEFQYMGFSLKVLDAYCPKSMQEKIAFEDPDVCREICMQHAYGNAVDVTLVMPDGTEVEMPTNFDMFCPQASSECMTVSMDAIKNRELLRLVMEKYGFIMSKDAWWHFEYFMDYDCEPFDIPFEAMS